MTDAIMKMLTKCDVVYNIAAGWCYSYKSLIRMFNAFRNTGLEKLSIYWKENTWMDCYAFWNNGIPSEISTLSAKKG